MAGTNASTPAILGGTPAVTLDSREANRWPVLTDEDFAAVRRVMEDGTLTRHPVAQEFEDDCREYFGVRHALTHCNGTMALLAAFFSLDLSPGDEVLVPTGTFWASVLPMLWLGLVPVFCESEPEQLGLDPADVEKKITSRSRALVVVHLWGMPSRMDELKRIAEKHNLRIIEDASHSQGARFRGQLCGTLGDVAAISLMGSKLVPAGEGGLLLTNDDALHERTVCLGDITRIMKLKSPAKRFAATGFGMKTRIASLSAALAQVQLRHLDARNQKRQDNILYLSEKLRAYGVETFPGPEHVERVYYEFNVALPEGLPLPKELLVAALQAEGCEVCLPLFPLLHQQPFFTEGEFKKILRPDTSMEASLPDFASDSCPETSRLAKRLIKLPVFPNASRELLDQYRQALDKVVHGLQAIGEAAQTRNLVPDPRVLFAGVDQLL